MESLGDILLPQITDSFEVRIAHVTDFKEPAVLPFFQVFLNLLFQWGENVGVDPKSLKIVEERG